MKKIILMILILVLLIVVGFFLFYSYNNELNTNIEVIDQNMVNKENTIAYGVMDLRGNIIDSGSELPLENNSAEVIFSLDHNIDEEREYLLLIFEDYKLLNYSVDDSNKQTKNFFFDMSPISSKEIKLSFSVDKSSHEVAFVVIKKPSYQLEEMDLNRANILGETLNLRYTVNEQKNNKKQKALVENKPDQVLEDGLYDDLAISDKPNKVRATVTGEQKEQHSLSIGNSWGEDITYAVIALTNWEQDAIIDNKEIIFTTVENESRNVFNFKLPSVNEDTNFQFISFPFAYEMSEDNYQSHSVFDTFRIFIKNE